jgi:hypothetical protein
LKPPLGRSFTNQPITGTLALSKGSKSLGKVALVLLLVGVGMRLVIIFLTLITLSFATFVEGSTKVHILSYKVWKQKKLDEAKSIVASLKKEEKRQSQVKDAETDDKEDLSSKITQAEVNLGVAKELSANDYFLLYVSPQFKDNKDALLQAAKTLSSKDMAEILNAYQKKLSTPEIYEDDGFGSAENSVIRQKTAKAP